jgi:hypothetical protein
MASSPRSATTSASRFPAVHAWRATVWTLEGWCDWWKALMNSEGPIEDYIPHTKDEGGGRAVPRIEISNYDSEGLQDVLEEILTAP